VKSARNLPGVKTLPANLLNVVDIISHNTLLIEVDAVRIAEQCGESSSGEKTMQLHEILKRPLITEKNAALQPTGKYVLRWVGAEQNAD